MKTMSCACHRFEHIVRWIARIVSVLAMGLMLFFAAGEGVPNPLALPLREGIGVLCFGGILIGLAIAFRYETPGASIALGAWLLLQAIQIGANNRPAFNFAFALLVAPAFLYLIIPVWRRWKAGTIARQAPPATP